MQWPKEKDERTTNGLQNITQKTKDWAIRTPLSNSKPDKWAIMYWYVYCIILVSFRNFSIWFWNCSDSVVCFILLFISL